jgi:hypothetical protein
MTDTRDVGPPAADTRDRKVNLFKAIHRNANVVTPDVTGDSSGIKDDQ